MNYTEEELKTLIAGIGKPDARAMDEARKRQAELAKPPGSLGRLEWLGIRLAGITGRVHNTLEKRDLLVFCAVYGIAWLTGRIRQRKAGIDGARSAE